MGKNPNGKDGLEQFYDCESYGFCPKDWEIVQEVIRDYPGSLSGVIGDRRQGFLKCADPVKVRFIGCLYAYGEKGELVWAVIFRENL